MLQIKPDMKKILAVAFVAVLASCNNDSKVVTVKDDENGKTVVTTKGIAAATNELSKRVEELQKMKPYTTEEMKSFLPENLGGAEQSRLQVTNMMGTVYAGAEYDISDTTTVSVKLLDCAGEAGAGLYSVQFLAMLQVESENDNEIVRTIDYNGTKAIERYSKDGSEASFTWMANDRLLATLEGSNISLADLKKLAW